MNKIYNLRTRLAIVVTCLMIVFGAKAQTTVTINATGLAASFNTGSVSAAGAKNDGNMTTINSSANRGWAKFDLSTIPSSAVISSVNCIFTTFTSTSSTALNNLYGFVGDPSAIAGATLYTNCGAGTSFNNTAWTANALNTKALNATGVSFIQSNITSTTLCIGFVRASTNTYNIYGYPGTAAQQPQLQITYTIPPPCAGVPTAGTITGAATICSGLGTTLTLTGASTGATGLTYQWASSTTSGGPYTTLLGTALTQATGPMSATTYYVVTVGCTSSGMTATTAEFSLTVNPLPTVSVSPTTASLCQPGATAVPLTASGTATSYAWGPAAGLSATTGATVNANPATSTTYTVTGTDGNGCTATATSAFTVSEIPSITAVTATPPSVCSGGNSQLLANAGTTSTYTISSIPFAPIATPGAGVTTLCNAGTATTVLTAGSLDDGDWINQTIPFNFNFFGITYNSFAVSTNGTMILGAGAPNTYTNYGTTLPSAAAAHPSIGPLYSDLDFRTAGTINYFTSGTAPNRMLVINWSSGMFYNATGSLTTQMIIYESSNIIEVHTTSSTGTNAAVEGIQNAAGTTAFTVTGRNNATWVVGTPDAYRWSPSGGPLTYAWSPATFLSSTTINNPMANAVTATTTYTVTASNGTCSSTGTATITAGSALTSTSNITPNATICSGTTVTLNSVPSGGGAPYTYAWTGPASFTSTSQNPTVVASAAAAGTYTVVVTDNCTATSMTTVTLTVNALPSIAVTPVTGMICNPGGTAVSLTATGAGAGTYTWSPTAGLTPSTGATVSALPTGTTTYTVTGTDGNGCVGTATSAITVGVSPVGVTATAAPTAICSGGNSVLTGAGTLPAGTYCQPTSSCSFPDIISNVTFGGINRTSTCDGAASNGYTYYAAPNPTITAGVATPLSVSTGGDIEGAAVWIDYDQSGTFDASELVQNGFAGTNPATYATSITIPTTAYNGATRMRVRCTYNVNPNPTVGPCGNVTYGETEDYMITISGGTDPLTFAWSPATFLSGTTTLSVNATAATATTTYTFTATAASGCTATANTTLTVNPLPSAPAGTGATICSGNTAGLTATGTGTLGWYDASTGGVHLGSGASFTTPVLTTTTTYYVQDSSAAGCTSSRTAVTVTVNPLPMVMAMASSSSVCAGGSVTLTGMGSATSYTWTGGAMDGVAFTPTGTATYTVTGTDGNGCMNTDMTTVTVNPLPMVMAMASSNTICAGGSVTLTGMGSATSYTWTGGATDGVSFTPTGTATYTVTGTDGNGCMNTDMTTVTVNPLPTVTATSSVSTAVCAGTMVTLTGTGTATSYTWDNGVMDATAFAATSTIMYTVTGTDGNGCTNTDAITVTVNPTPIVDLGADQSLCGGTTTLDAGNAGATFMWNDGTTAQMLVADTTGTYTVTVDNGTCSAMDSVHVTISTMPVVDLGPDQTQCGGSVTLDATVTSATATYMWNDMSTAATLTANATGSYNVMVMDGACSAVDTIMVTINTLPSVSFAAFTSSVCDNAPAFALTGGSPAGGVYSGTGVSTGMFDPAVATAGTYTITYTVTDVNTCTNSATQDITVDFCTGVLANNGGTFTMYPNPTSGMFNISISNANFSELIITIVDVQGKEVYNVVDKNIASQYSKTINIESLAKGVYYVKLNTGADLKIEKLIVH